MTDGNDRAMSSPIYSYDNEMHMVGYANGLTKREAFAMAAMQGLCAAPDSGQWKAGQIANYAIEQADALITALNKPQETEA